MTMPQQGERLECPACGMGGIMERAAWAIGARTTWRNREWSCPKCRAVSLIVIHNGEAFLYLQEKDVNE